ncbi:MAG: DUF2934 domain-containing protein [Gammaproteobacteria bacterium]|nr:DUF2934 domain-containing protein [Gammaproteobacteria bacterium]
MAENNAVNAGAKSKKSAKKAVKKQAAAKKPATAKSIGAKATQKTIEKLSGGKPAATAARKSTAGPNAKKTKLAVKPGEPNDSKRFTLIQQTAYYIAEKRGFTGGNPEQDWLQAEKQVDEMLKSSST